jgi:hypothetical protein
MNFSSPEPPPKPNDSTPIWELVIADMRERDHSGRAKYGVPLQAGNGRDALVDAYQEALDLAVYLRQAIEERDDRATRLAERTTLRAGDIVRTKTEPTEDWVLATDEEHGRVYPAGWPCTLADADELELIEAATDEKRLGMLRQVAAMTEPDPRRALAMQQLEDAER